MKKVLSLLLSVLMLAACISPAASVSAKEAKTVNVDISAFANGGFISIPRTIAVSSSLSDEYASQVGFNDSSSEPTILDAAIAAHLEFIGENFMDTAPLKVSEQGWIENCFGRGSALSYYLNGVSYPLSLTTSVAEGDFLEFDFFSDTTNWSDLYISADKRVQSVAPGEKVTIKFTASNFSGSQPAAGLSVTVNNSISGHTDENGAFSFTPSNIGGYDISLKGTLNGTPIFRPWCTVNCSTKLFDYLLKEITGAVDYYTANVDSFGVEDAPKLALLLLTDVDNSKYKESFAKAVLDNLTENGGRLMMTDYQGNKYEDIGIYGAVNLCLDYMGYNSNNFYGLNLKDIQDSLDLAEARPRNPYNYKYAVITSDDERAKAICQDMIDNFYTLGKGLDYWGYSCDNTCHFLITVAMYAEDFPEYVEDAKKVIKTYAKKNGAYADNTYVTTVNADSTALSAAAFAVAGDYDTALKYYTQLIKGFEGEKPGVILYDGAENLYATADGMIAFISMLQLVFENNAEYNGHIYYEKITPATYKKAGKSVKTCKLCGEAVTKKIPKKKVKKTAIKKLTAKKNAAQITWKKVKGVTGYQLQYSTKKNFKKSKKLLIKNAKQKKAVIKKLASGKKYYFRIRAFKKDGSRHFSKWSAVKNVKIK